MTMPKLREQHIGRTEIRFAERPHHQPEALLEWFYPGRAAGHEFIYPQRQGVKLNRDPKQDIYLPALNSRPPAS